MKKVPMNVRVHQRRERALARLLSSRRAFHGTIEERRIKDEIATLERRVYAKRA